MKNTIEVLQTKIEENHKKENKDLDPRSERKAKMTTTSKRMDIDLERTMDILRRRMKSTWMMVVLVTGIGMITQTRKILVSLTSRSSISLKSK
jgi:hypothetical protein